MDRDLNAATNIVCSAHAEVIPHGVVQLLLPVGLLRTRGGDPEIVDGVKDLLESAPHTRR